MVETGGGDGWWRRVVETGGGDGWWRRVVETGGGDGWWRRMVETGGGDGWWRRVVETGGGDGWWRRMVETDDGDGSDEGKNQRPVSVPASFRTTGIKRATTTVIHVGQQCPAFVGFFNNGFHASVHCGSIRCIVTQYDEIKTI